MQHNLHQNNHSFCNIRQTKGNYLADFFRLGGTPPPTPLTENQCEKKKVFFLNGKSQMKILKKMGQKGLKLAFLGQKKPFLADFFLNVIGGTPPPLTEKIR